MNRQAVIFHLREAKEQLDELLSEMESEPSYDSAELQVAMSHLYHHLNTAWNGRDQTDEQFKKCAQRDFNAWRKFPRESDLFLE
jgi:hypothetical protein